MDIEEALSARRSSEAGDDDKDNNATTPGTPTGGRNEGDVVASLRQLESILGESVLEQLVNNDRIRLQLSGMTRSDGMEAVQKLGDSIAKRQSADLDPIADPVGYFLRILSRYKKDGEVVITLKRLGRKSIGEDVVEKILSNEKVRPQLSSLSKSEGLEAVEKLGQSLAKRSADLDPINDPAGYFLKILSRYNTNDHHNSSRNKKRRGNDDEHFHYYDNNSDDDLSDEEDAEDGDLHSQLRLAKRRAGTFQVKYYKAERTVAKLEGKIKDLTSELESTKSELELLKKGG